MKKKLLIGLLATVCILGSVMAQGGMQRQTPEERINATMLKLAPLALNADQTTKTTAVITDFYTAQQKAVQEMRASGSRDRAAMMAKRTELSNDRDKKLKEIFTDDQYKKWKDEIEPSLRPQRGRGQR
jgi:hypothetical protein